jgi:hypothetical protein
MNTLFLTFKQAQMFGQQSNTLHLLVNINISETNQEHPFLENMHSWITASMPPAP